jgi:hypothetical protein
VYNYQIPNNSILGIFDNVPFRDVPDTRPDNPAFFDILYPAGYQIALPNIRLDIR